MKSSYLVALACALPLTSCGLFKKSNHSKWTGKKTKVAYDITSLDEARFGKGKNPVAVLVVDESTKSDQMSTCTSFAISDRLVMTNDHCIEATTEGLYVGPTAIQLYFKAPGQSEVKLIEVEKIVRHESIQTDHETRTFTGIEGDSDWAILKTKESIAEFGFLSLDVRELNEDFFDGSQKLETIRINPPEDISNLKWTLDIVATNIHTDNALNEKPLDVLSKEKRHECFEVDAPQVDCFSIEATMADLLAELRVLQSFQFVGLVRSGNSGSPILNAKGNVVALAHKGFYPSEDATGDTDQVGAQVLHSIASRLSDLSGLRLIK
jgi:hypothetical protein